LADTQLSSGMICWNEAQTIDLALKSISNFVDEVIIIDTGSFDGTQKIARETIDNLNLSGQIKEVTITKLFDARLKAFQLCDGDWMLMQDSNLVLSNALKQEMLGHIKRSNALGCVKSLNLMGDYEHLFGNRPFMAPHDILIKLEKATWDESADRPHFIGTVKTLSNWAVNLSRVRPAWRYWLRGEQFDRRAYNDVARRHSDGHKNKFNTQYSWQRLDKYTSPLEYIEVTKGMTLNDVKQVAPAWFLKQLRLEARHLVPAYRQDLPEVIQDELKNPRYKLIYENNKITGRWPEL